MTKKQKVGKIEVDRELCIGAGTCVVLAGKTFDLDDEAKVIIIDPKGNLDEEIIDAAISCPVFAIKVYDEKGNLIYPK